MNKLMWIFLTLSLVLAGCNTVSGIGKDIENAGQTIDNAAKKNDQ